MSQIPYCTALLVCDFVHRDPATRKYSILGTFDRLYCHQNLEEPTPTGVFLSLANGHGKVHCDLSLVHSENYKSSEKPLFNFEFEVAFENPLQPVEVGLNLKVAYQQTGVFYWQVWAGEGENRQLLLEKPLHVSTPPENP
ncbi:MAG: hypothetical protein HUJ26_15425 [Planctomycetaceae bacterium]|nr:hypothetical protein [Planctomycetaceae bacterium]